MATECRSQKKFACEHCDKMEYPPLMGVRRVGMCGPREFFQRRSSSTPTTFFFLLSFLVDEGRGRTNYH